MNIKFTNVLQFTLSYATYDTLLTKYAVFEKIERTVGVWPRSSWSREG